jgi:hypothetical protein
MYPGTLWWPGPRCCENPMIKIDFKRELKRKIARTRPVFRKIRRKKQVLIVDNRGQIKSGDYLPYFLVFFLAATLICIGAAGLFFVRFDRLSHENQDLAFRAGELETRVQTLTREKQVLMAQLVIAGRDPDPAFDKSPIPETDTGMYQIDNASDRKTQAPVPGRGKQTVDIEDFSIIQDNAHGDLLVTFNIRNVSQTSKEVSGHIFTILKPNVQGKDPDQDQWRVVPDSPLENGLPVEIKKGQSFVISHFKPVKFKIENVSGQASFTTASVLVFNDQGELMLQNDIDIQ